jgi:hypothetical protein
MKRTDVMHILRSAVVITGCKEWVVLGSQALALWDGIRSAPLEASEELDVYAPESEAMTDLVEGTLGEGSMFQDTFGYFAHGVGADTAVFPADWLARSRLEPIHGADGAHVRVPHPTDIAIAKLMAFRAKDTAFVREMLQCGLTTLDQINVALGEVHEHKALRERAERWLNGLR